MDGSDSHLSGIHPSDEGFRKEGFFRIAGVDEAGRGPLAGPVVAAAVILPSRFKYPLPLDSKKFPPKKRLSLYREIAEQSLAWFVSRIEHDEIDRVNILQASLTAMALAVGGLGMEPDLVLVDGGFSPPLSYETRCIIRGDSLSLSIGAASILAKVHRDRIMEEYHRRYPQYGFDRHKGYGTREHLEALRENGPCPIHRTSFRGVKEHL